MGCGHGLIHPYLLANNKKLQLSGVDVASSVIDIALTTNPNVAYQTYDGSTLPYAENTFDVAYAICVMHHVPQCNGIIFTRNEASSKSQWLNCYIRA